MPDDKQRTTVQIVGVRNGVEKHMVKMTIYEEPTRVWKAVDEMIKLNGFNMQRPKKQKATR